MRTVILSSIAVVALATFALSFLSPGVRAQDASDKANLFEKTQWEYRALRIDDRQRSGGREADLRARRSSSQDALNQLGAEGWELVAVRNDPAANSNTVFYFKRLKR